MSSKKICDICGGEGGVRNSVNASRDRDPHNIMIGGGVQFFTGDNIDICDTCVENLGLNPSNKNWLKKLLENGKEQN